MPAKKSKPGLPMGVSVILRERRAKRSKRHDRLRKFTLSLEAGDIKIALTKLISGDVLCRAAPH